MGLRRHRSHAAKRRVAATGYFGVIKFLDWFFLICHSRGLQIKDSTDISDFQKLIGVLSDPNERPRSIAIVGAAYLEDYLGRNLRLRMPSLNSDLREKIFEGTGPLSTASARIDFARSLDLITGEQRKDIINIARVRNRFAHNFHVDNFTALDIPACVTQSCQEIKLVLP
jgi:hypothetical protein